MRDESGSRDHCKRSTKARTNANNARWAQAWKSLLLIRIPASKLENGRRPARLPFWGILITAAAAVKALSEPGPSELGPSRGWAQAAAL
jgi:hypothetical protein